MFNSHISKLMSVGKKKKKRELQNDGFIEDKMTDAVAYLKVSLDLIDL